MSRFEVYIVMSYNNDIAHCNGDGCPLAGQCERYRLFTIWDGLLKAHYPYTNFTEPMYDKESGDCELYRPFEYYG